MITATLSDSKTSSSGSDDSYNGDGNYSTFMAMTSVDLKEDLSELNEELGEYTDVEEDEAMEDEEEYLNEGERKFQVVYDALLKD